MPNHTSKLSLLLQVAGCPLQLRTLHARATVTTEGGEYVVTNEETRYSTFEAALRAAASQLAAARPTPSASVFDDN